jgi:predicted PurR-regulated permease PerM
VRSSDSLRRYLILGLSVPLVALNVWILGQIFSYFEYVLTVITVAAIAAFLLNNIVEGLQRLRLRRDQAILLVLLITLAALGIAGFVLIPLTIQQTTQLLQGLPGWLENGDRNLTGLSRFANSHNLYLNLDEIKTQLTVRAQALLELLPGLAIGTLGRLLDTVLILVLAFYMLFYGGRLWQGLINLLPAPFGAVIGRSLRFNFQRFFIVQLLLALFMFLAMLPVMMFFRVNFGFLFALLIAASQLIPVVGATLGIGIVVLLVILQSLRLAILVGIAAIVLQQIKDNLLAPKMLGNMIGLNPLWQFIALLIGARMAGLLGVVLSIPIAGAIKSSFEELKPIRQPPVPANKRLPPRQS